MNPFRQIYRFLNKRKKLVKKLIKSESTTEKIRDQIKKLEQPFHEAKIDVEKYRDFFSKYYVLFEDGSKYKIEKIYQTIDYQGHPFYQVLYVFESKNSKSNGTLSLRKFLHLLDQTNAKLKKIC